MKEVVCASDLTESADVQRPWDLYSPRRRRMLLFVLFLVGTSSYIDKNIIGVLIEPIKAEFHTSDKVLGLLSGFSFALFYATLGVPVARWADRGDRPLVITSSLFVWSVMTAVCGFTSTFWQLAVARFGVGAGEAGALPPAQSLIADYYPPTERARGIGIFMLSSAAGYSIALAIGGVIAQTYGWRYAFIIVGAIGMILTPVTRMVLHEPRNLPQFAIHRRSCESSRTAVRALFAKPAYRYLFSGVVLYYFVSNGVVVFTVPFMTRVHGLTLSEAGIASSAISTIGALVGGIGGGMLADRLAGRNLAWLARIAGWGIIATIPCYEMAFLSPTSFTMICMLVLAITLLATAIPAMFSALHVVCGSKRRAFAVAMTLFFANLIGAGLGPVVAGAMSDAFGSIWGSATGLTYALTTIAPMMLFVGALLLSAARHLSADAED